MRLQLMGYHSCPEKADHGQLIYGLRHQQKVISPAYQGSKIQQTKAIFISYMLFSKEHDLSAGCQPLFNHKKPFQVIFDPRKIVVVGPVNS